MAAQLYSQSSAVLRILQNQKVGYEFAFLFICWIKPRLWSAFSWMALTLHQEFEPQGMLQASLARWVVQGENLGKEASWAFGMKKKRSKCCKWIFISREGAERESLFFPLNKWSSVSWARGNECSYQLSVQSFWARGERRKNMRMESEQDKWGRMHMREVRRGVSPGLQFMNDS